MSGVGTAIGVGAAIGGVGSIASGAIGASAAKDAASQQSAAANRAADLNYKASQDALQFQKDQYADTQKNLAPWLQSGTGALSNLNYLLGLGGGSGATLPTLEPPPPTGTGIPVHPTQGQPGSADSSFGSLMQPYPGGSFKAPTGLDLTNDPGYLARLKLGTDTLQRSAAARGNLLTGGTAKALDQYAQDYASGEYNNVYNRALTNYTTDYNQWNQQQTKQFNNLAALAGIGQQTASTLSQAGQNTANAVGANLTGTAAAMGQNYTNAASANASGIINSANAWGGGLQGVGNIVNNSIGQYSQLQMLQQLLSRQGGGPFSV